RRFLRRPTSRATMPPRVRKRSPLLSRRPSRRRKKKEHRPVAEITVAQVKELRERTGAGMMDCKEALVENDGDVDAAATWLREKGIAQAAKRSGRETNEGKVAADLEETYAGMVAVGCETEPVSNNE